MDREQEILELVPEESQDLVREVVSQMVFLENQLIELKKYPFIQINPKNPAQQRATPASKMYKEYLQQYLNCIKTLEALIYRDKRLEGTTEEESPLRSWFNAHKRT